MRRLEAVALDRQGLPAELFGFAKVAPAERDVGTIEHALEIRHRRNPKGEPHGDWRGPAWREPGAIVTDSRISSGMTGAKAPPRVALCADLCHTLRQRGARSGN